MTREATVSGGVGGTTDPVSQDSNLASVPSGEGRRGADGGRGDIQPVAETTRTWPDLRDDGAGEPYDEQRRA
jgi:hypothetical protein